MGFLLLLNASPRTCHFSIEYGEFLGIIEGYDVGSLFLGQIIIEGDSIFAIKSLSSNFVSSIDVSLVSFLHVFRIGNCPTHLLAKDALAFDSEQEWFRNILSYVAHSISLDFNNT